ncbi:MAG: PKD domain-containing protein [Pseudomonadales bacterium]
MHKQRQTAAYIRRLTAASVLLSCLPGTILAETNILGAADGSFETGLGGMTTTGDAMIVTGLGILEATEGGQALLLTTEPDFGSTPADADVSTISIASFTIDPAYETLRIDYNLLTDEPDPSFANDAFSVKLVLVTAGGEETLLTSDTFDSFYEAPWTGYGLQTGFRTMVANVAGSANGSDLVTLELRIEDLGDGRRDSAVLVDDIRLVEPGAPEARVAAPYLQITPGQSILFDGSLSTDDVGIVSYAWNFDNGYVGSGPFISFNQYTAPGFHQGTLTVTDADGHSDTTNFTVVVGDINTAPSIVSTPNTAASEAVPYRYQVAVADAEIAVGDVITYALTTMPAGMTIDPATGLISWLPGTGIALRHDVTVEVADSFGATASQSYTITMGAEVYIGAITYDNRLFTGTSRGDGTFDFRPEQDVSTGGTTAGVVIADFDGDDDFDLITGTPNSALLDLYLFRREAGQFLAPVYLGGFDGSNPGYLMDMAAEDFDNDADMDFVLDTNTARAWYFENTGPLVTEAENFLVADFETGNDGWGGQLVRTSLARDNTTAPPNGSTWSMRVFATGTPTELSIDINPSNMYFTSGSSVRFDYRIPAGTPVGMLLNVYDINGTLLGWVQIGGTASADPGIYPVSPHAVPLIDDDAWHTAEIDIYQAVRSVYPTATRLAEFEWYTANNATTGQQFWFDDFRFTRPRMVSGFTATQLPDAGTGSGRGMDAGDVDHDGNMDFVRGLSNGPIYLYRGDGAGGFTTSQIGTLSDVYGIAVADFDNDGLLDVFGANGSTGDGYFYQGNGDGTFLGGVLQPSLDLGTYGAYAPYDFDNDGNTDIVASTYTLNQIWYYPGNGDATFGTRQLVSAMPSSSMGVAAPVGRVNGQPFARATANLASVNEGGVVSFDATASYDDGSIASYDWDFGDGNVGTGETVDHTFLNEGDFTVVLTVTDDDGQMDSFGVRVVVYGNNPVADTGGVYVFGEQNAINGHWHGTLDGTASSDADGPVVRYEWDFDAADGLQVDSVEVYPRPTYAAAGTYTVTLTVYDQVGQTGTTTTTVTAQGADTPVADLVGPATLDETAASLGTWTGWYDVAASADVQGIASYLLDWDDGTSLTLSPTADNFDDGDYAGWTVNGGGTWTVVDGEVNVIASGGAWRWLQDVDRTYQDFELEFDFNVLPGTTDGYVGIAFHHPNTAGNSGAQNSFLLYSLNSWDFWRFYDWNTAATLAEGGVGFDPDRWYHMRLRVVGDTMQLFVTPEGGTETLQVEATSAAHPEGGIGLLAYNQSMRYDNVKVTPLDSDWTQGGATLGTITHGFASAGDYDVTLTISDHADQSDAVLLTTSAAAGDAPVADPGGPYVVDEADAYGSHWEFALDASASSDDTSIQRYTVDFGDGTVYTSGMPDGNRGTYFAVGTDLYGYDTTDASLQRIVATEDGTFIEIIDLQTRSVLLSNTLNRFQTWNGVSPGDGVYYKVRASKPVAAYFTDLSNHSAFMPSLDASPVGREFIFHLDNNSGFYLYAHQDAAVTFFNTSGAALRSFNIRAGEYQLISGLSDAVYRVVATGDVAMQTTGVGGYTTVPASNGDGAGRLFYFATTAGTGAIAAFAHEAADVEVFDLDTGASLYTATIAAGDMWYQNAVGTRRLRLASTADVEVWAGDTEGGTAIINLGDDVSFAGGRAGTEFVLHNLMDGIVIFAPNNATDISIDGAPASTLQRDQYLALAPTDFASGSGVHTIVSSRPVLIQTLGRANAFNDMGTYLGGNSMRHRYTATGTYTLSLTVTDNAGQTDIATTTVDVQANDPPVPDLVAPAVADESFATGGLWTVDFDATGSSDDFGIFSYEWDFGDGTTGSGAEVSHDYGATGSYEVTLTITDNAGQAVSTSTTVEVVLGAGPNADAGGPYVFGEAAASYGVWTATLDASGSTDDAGIFDYRWEFPSTAVDDFEDGVVDTGLWTVGSNTTEAAGRMTIAGSSNWALQGFRHAGAPVERAAGTEFRTQVISSANTMVGVFPVGVADFNYTSLVHAIYFAGASVYIYENGSNRGYQGSFAANTLYDVRIVLRDQGADYYLRQAGAGSWTQLTAFTSLNSTESPLQPGASVYSGTSSFDNTSVVPYLSGAVVTREYSEPTVESVTLRVRDNALQESFDTTTITIEDGDAPVAQAAGPYTAEVGSFVAFNGTGSTDDNAIQQYHWGFGEMTGGPDAAGSQTANLEYTDRGAAARHFYKTVGTYDVELTVTDNTLKTGTDTTTVNVIVGDAPVAAVRAPTTGGANGPPVYFDATPSSDDFGITEYRWDFDADVDSDGDGNFTNDIDAVGATPFHVYPSSAEPAGVILEDDFDGPALDSSVWLSAGAIQSGGTVNLTGISGWGNRYVTSVQNFDRGRQSVYGQVLQGTVGNGFLMWGVKDTSTNYSYTVMPHAFYFYNGTLYIYENGFNRGAVGTYIRGVQYDLRIDLLSAGANYFIRQTGETNWTQLTGYTSLNSTTNPLKLHAVVNSGDASFDNFSVESLGPYVATLTVEDGAGQTSTTQTQVAVEQNVAPDVITVPWVAFDPLVPHETYSGKAIRVKGIVRDADPVTYQWDFGDGTASAVLPVTNPYDLSVVHTYPAAPIGTPFTATLTVTDSVGNTGSATYPVIVRPLNLTTEINIAIDEGLWYLHQTQTRSTAEGFDTGYWTSNARASATASAIQSFQVNGHLESVSHRDDPYAETVARGLRQLFRDLGTVAIGTQVHGEPDTNGNGIGIQTGLNGSGGQPIYQGGQVMDAIASAGNPLARTVTGAAGILRRSYFDILTDMADQFAWGQSESGSSTGGWRYAWNADSDNSAAQWGAIGMKAAEDTFGIPIPAWVKEQNQVLLNTNYGNPGWGYTSGGATQAGTPSGLVQMVLGDQTKNDHRWIASERWVAQNWTTQYIITPGNRPYYAMYALTKAMRLAEPEAVENFGYNGFDWFRDPVLGLARTLVDDQSADGSFPGTSLITGQLRSAWGVIMLSRSLFQQPPVADAGRDRVWGVDIPLEFDGSGSFHLDPFRSLVLYEWDFDGDGVFDYSSNEPTATYTYTTADYPEASLPQAVVARLRVTDNNIPALTDTDTVEIIIAIPPHPPHAEAAGPYTCTAGIPCPLDGTASFDIDPTDFITLYEWDLDGFPFDYTGATGPNPTPIFAEGLHTISLRVYDNAVLNDVNGNGLQDPEERLTDVDFTSVTVVANLPPVANANGPYVIDEGSSIVLTSAGSSDPNGDPLTFLWDYDTDGEYDDALGASPSFLGVDDGDYPIGLRVTDSLLDAFDVATVTVNNVAPLVDAGLDTSISEGGGVTFGGTFTDPGTADTHTIEWDFGDGAAASGSLTPTHPYTEDGVYTVTLTVTDDDGGVGSDTLIVTVGNTPPVVDAGLDRPAVPSGGTVNLDPATFTDAGVEDTHTASIDWGDGTVEPGALTQGAGSGTVAGGHVYAAAGDYTVTVTVTDDDGGVGSDTLLVTVLAQPNTAPVPDAGAGATIVEGDTFNGAGSFTDPDADTWTATVDYGDGSGVQPLTLAGMAFTLGHVYADNGTYTVTVTVADSQGGSNSDTATVVVNNAAPVVNAGADQPGVAFGGTVNLDPATFTDAGVEDTHTASIDWGDGTVEPGALTQGAGSGTVAGGHVYAAAGDYTVTVTVTDDDGGIGSDTLLVTVEQDEVEPPPAPTDLSARPKNGKIQLVWTHTGADSYNVYRSASSGGPYTMIANTTSTYSTYLDEGLTNGVRLYYVVTAVVDGVESTTPSNEASATPSARAR